MSTVKTRLWAPNPHKAVDWNQTAIEKRLAQGPLFGCIKYDGFRCLVARVGGAVRITTREGIELTSLQNFRPAWGDLLDKFHNRCFDGEVIIQGMPFEEASGLLRRNDPIPADKEHLVKFVVFDFYEYDAALKKTTTPPRCDRLIPLMGLLTQNYYEAQIVLEQHEVIKSTQDIEQLYFRARLLGYEGLILKDPLLPCRNGKVTGWWKVKPGCGAEFAPGFEADGITVDYVWGEVGKANEGCVVGYKVRLEGEDTVVNCTGLTQEAIAKATNRAATGRIYGTKPDLGRACRVSGMERTKDGSIRHPHFDGFRDIDGAEGLKA